MPPPVNYFVVCVLDKASSRFGGAHCCNFKVADSSHVACQKEVLGLFFLVNVLGLSRDLR